MSGVIYGAPVFYPPGLAGRAPGTDYTPLDGVTMPAAGQAFDSVPLTATLTVPAGQGLNLDQLFTRGFYVVNVGTLQVVAR